VAIYLFNKIPYSSLLSNTNFTTFQIPLFSSSPKSQTKVDSGFITSTDLSFKFWTKRLHRPTFNISLHGKVISEREKIQLPWQQQLWCWCRRNQRLQPQCYLNKCSLYTVFVFLIVPFGISHHYNNILYIVGSEESKLKILDLSF